jgi:hypothetical protein
VAILPGVLDDFNKRRGFPLTSVFSCANVSPFPSVSFVTGGFGACCASTNQKLKCSSRLRRLDRYITSRRDIEFVDVQRKRFSRTG